uniref:Nucleophosmin n=1 Tax=Poecilia reticulata TaxID=8081 RepID=A0A3P9NK62_POERE
KVDLDDEDTEQQLSLKAVCLGAEAEDKFHMVEVEGLTYDAKTSKVPIAVLKPSVLPSMNLGGFEITPPVTFRLVSGSGPVHISGQHFVSKYYHTNSDNIPENPSKIFHLLQKKMKMDSDDEDDDDDEEDSDEDEEE